MLLALSAAALAAPPIPMPGLSAVARIDDDVWGATLAQGGRVEARGDRCVVDRASTVIQRDALGAWTCQLDRAGALTCSSTTRTIERTGIAAFAIVGNDSLCTLDREGSVTLSYASRPGSVPVRGMREIVEIAHGGHGVCCGRDAEGASWCAGAREWSDRQPLGDGATGVPLVPDAVQLAYGGLVLRRDGTLWVVGSLTGDVQAGFPSPTRVPEVPADLVQVAYSAYGPRVLRRDGSVWDVRWNPDGTLGGADRMDVPPVQALFAGLSTCVRLRDGEVRCDHPLPDWHARLTCLAAALR